MRFDRWILQSTEIKLIICQSTVFTWQQVTFNSLPFCFSGPKAGREVLCVSSGHWGHAKSNGGLRLWIRQKIKRDNGCWQTGNVNKCPSSFWWFLPFSKSYFCFVLHILNSRFFLLLFFFLRVVVCLVLAGEWWDGCRAHWEEPGQSCLQRRLSFRWFSPNSQTSRNGKLNICSFY